MHRIGQELCQGGVRMVGTSGTVTTLAGIVLNLPRYSRPAVDGAVLSRDDAEAALARLRTLGRGSLVRQYPASAPTGPNSCCSGYAFSPPSTATSGRPQKSWWPNRGLREGMLLRMIRAERARGQRRLRGYAAGVTPPRRAA